MIAAMIFAAAMLGAPGEAVSAAGCADHWLVSVGKESFEYNGAGVSFSAAQLDDLEARIEPALKRAIDEACTDGAVAPEKTAPVSSVIVMSASGATEPHFYLADHYLLVFEWGFAEEGLAVPSDADIVAGTVCWTDPDGDACQSMGD